MTTTEKINTIILERYPNDYAGRRNMHLRQLHAELRQKLGEEKFLAFLEDQEENNPKPKYQPIIFNEQQTPSPMSEETIIIQTEVVKVSDLQGREKQIYDYAHAKGYNEALNRNKATWAIVITRCFLMALIAAFIFMCIKMNL